MDDLAPTSLHGEPVLIHRDWRMPGEGVRWARRNAQTVEQVDAVYRERYAVTRSEIARRMMEGVDRDARVIEVGSAHGLQLEILRRLGFRHVTGCDLSHGALALGRGNRVACDALALPFRGGACDLVFTSGVLIHIDMPDLPTAVREMARVTTRWLAGMEYWAPRRGQYYSEAVPDIWQDDYTPLVARLSGMRVRYSEVIHPPAENCAPLAAYLLEKA